MAIIIAGNEGDIITPGIGFTTNASYFDSNYSRVACELSYNLYSDIALSGENIGAADSQGFWLGFTYGGTTADTENYLVQVYDNTGTACYRARGTGGTAVKTSIFSDSGSLVDKATGIVFSGSLKRYDIHVYTDSGSTYGEIYINGALEDVISCSGSNRGLNKVRFWSITGNGIYNNYRAYVSEVIIATEPTLGMRVKTLSLTADGSHTDFTGSYTDVDEITLDGVKMITNTGGHIQTFAHSGGLASDAKYKALVMSMNVAQGENVPMDGVVRIGGVDYFASFAYPAAFIGSEARAVVFEANPATETAWTGSAINSTEIGLRRGV